MNTKRIMIAFTLLCLALFLSNSVLAAVVTIDYKIPCDQTLQTMTLGEFTATAYPTYVDANFVVASDVQIGKTGSNGIWQCMELHWLQTIWHDDGNPPPTFGGGNTWDPPIIDPPKGGWDPPAQPAGDDDQPWYWKASEELNENVIGIRYHFSDGPGILTDPNYLGFSTYLCAISTAICNPQPDECLDIGEILVLGGFDWKINSITSLIQATFSEPAADDLTQINTALSTAGFSGWSAVGDKAICCLPEPATISLLVLGSLLLIRRKSA